MKNRIEIENAFDFEGWASDLLSAMTESIQDDQRYCLPIDEQTEYDPDELDDTWSYIFTRRGQKLVEHWTDRFHRIGKRLFPNVSEFEIENWYYQEG